MWARHPTGTSQTARGSRRAARSQLTSTWHTTNTSAKEDMTIDTRRQQTLNTQRSTAATAQTYPVAAHVVGADRVRGCPRSASQSQQHQAGCPHGQLMRDCSLCSSSFLFFSLRPITTGRVRLRLYFSLLKECGAERSRKFTLPDLESSQVTYTKASVKNEANIISRGFNRI